MALPIVPLAAGRAAIAGVLAAGFDGFAAHCAGPAPSRLCVFFSAFAPKGVYTVEFDAVASIVFGAACIAVGEGAFGSAEFAEVVQV